MKSQKTFKKKLLKVLSQWQLYVLCLPAILQLIILRYLPMYGLQIAFKDYTFADGIIGSEWVGIKHFVAFFNAYNFKALLWNSITLSIYSMAIFPLPVLLALMIHNVRNKKFKGFVQTVTYAPHFISLVVLVGMLRLFLGNSGGIINNFIEILGGNRVNFIALPQYFRGIYIFSEVWQSTGWGAIIYLAALSSISPSLYEAAKIDGANRLHIIRFVEIPGIMPTVIIMFILKLGSFMNAGYQKVFLLQSASNILTSEIIQTYVYKIGVLQAQYSFATAAGLFNTTLNIILLITANQLSKRYSETSLW